MCMQSVLPLDNAMRYYVQIWKQHIPFCIINDLFRSVMFLCVTLCSVAVLCSKIIAPYFRRTQPLLKLSTVYFNKQLSGMKKRRN